jgi:peptidoglycan hydrolase-like protein with peptidoglycan-binding domain
MSRFRIVALAAFALAAGAFASTVVLVPAAAADRKSTQQTVPTQEVRNLQLALNRKGARLPVDGLMTPKTIAALKDYQRRNKLVETGELDPRTKSAFGLR